MWISQNKSGKRIDIYIYPPATVENAHTQTADELGSPWYSSCGSHVRRGVESSDLEDKVTAHFAVCLACWVFSKQFPTTPIIRWAQQLLDTCRLRRYTCRGQVGGLGGKMGDVLAPNGAAWAPRWAASAGKRSNLQPGGPLSVSESCAVQLGFPQEWEVHRIERERDLPLIRN